MTQRFEKAYNALHRAFMDDTLAKGTCIACAVGNIVSDAMGGKVIKIGKTDFVCFKKNTFWKELFCTDIFTHEQVLYDGKSVRKNKIKDRLKKLTNYSWEELAKIEHAFETNTKIYNSQYGKVDEKAIMEDQFNGLMAVMDVMIELDEIKEGEQYKDTFKKKFAETI